MRDAAEPPRRSLGDGVEEFAGPNADYYARAFARLQNAGGLVVTWNWAAALGGPLWAAWRNLWGWFWLLSVLELVAWVQIGRGLWGDLGAEQSARVEKLEALIATRLETAATLSAAGDEVGAQSALAVAENLRKAAAQAGAQAEAAAGEALSIAVAGLVLLLVLRGIAGLFANAVYERRYLRWRVDPGLGCGAGMGSLGIGVLGLLAVWPLTLYRFTAASPAGFVTGFPLGRELFSPVARAIEAGFDWLALAFGGVFRGITAAIATLLDALEVLTVGTPWPVVMLMIVVLAWRLAGPRVAVFSAAALAYLALFGLWELSMVTVALLAASGFLCIAIGIPLGIWFGRSPRAHAAAEPVLDFMQTMPAFVYLIPIIAFFGTGKPPGVLATIVFAMPPVIRLTALGIRQVPETTKEAALAFGCTDWQLLRRVEIPLAMPSVMTGINQTILMCLSMVVIASLIGAGGLGSAILEALQYAAKGQGLLAGLAILLCAMVVDRIIQGSYRRRSRRARR